jgi:hypothetical protein
MSKELAVDPVVLREEVKTKYREVALNPRGEYHFHTGRPLARRLGYDSALADSMPDAAVESFGWQTRFPSDHSNKEKGLSMPDQVEGLTALSPRIKLVHRAKLLAWTCSRRCSRNAATPPRSWVSKTSSFARDFWRRYH